MFLVALVFGFFAYWIENIGYTVAFWLVMFVIALLVASTMEFDEVPEEPRPFACRVSIPARACAGSRFLQRSPLRAIVPIARRSMRRSGSSAVRGRDGGMSFNEASGAARREYA